MGKGSPQYRCRANSQSRSLKLTLRCPMPLSSSHSIAAALAASVASPFRSSPLLLLPELTATPAAVNATGGAESLPLLPAAAASAPPAAAAAGAATTCFTGRPKA